MAPEKLKKRRKAMWATEIIKIGEGIKRVVEYKDMTYSAAMNSHNYYMMRYVGDYKTYFVWREPQ